MSSGGAQRLMPYKAQDFLFIILNIFHDILHDYGRGADDSRWGSLEELFPATRLILEKEFDPNRDIEIDNDTEGRLAVRQAFAGARTRNRYGHNGDKNPSKARSSKKQSTQKYNGNNREKQIKKKAFATFKQRKSKKELIFLNELDDFIQCINTKFLFNCFCALLKKDSATTSVFLSNSNSFTELALILTESTDYSLNSELLPNGKYADVFENLLIYFVIYLKGNSLTTKPLKQLFVDNDVKKFLNSPFILTSIYDSIGLLEVSNDNYEEDEEDEEDYTYDVLNTYFDETKNSFVPYNYSQQLDSDSDSDSDSVDEFSKEISGGAKDDDFVETDSVKLQGLITRLTETRDVILQSLPTHYNIFNPNEKQIGSNQTAYMTFRSEWLRGVKEILVLYGQNKKAGSVDNASSCANTCCFLPPIPRSSRALEKIGNDIDTFTRTCLTDYYNSALILYYQNILDSIKIRLLVRQNRESNAVLNTEQKKMREQFCNMIAKLGLFLTHMHSESGGQISPIALITDGISIPAYVRDSANDAYLFYAELNLLANCTGANVNDQSRPNEPKWGVTNVATNVGSNIDVELYNIAEAHYKSKRNVLGVEDYPVCKNQLQNKLQYVIDNAAMTSNVLKDLVFCPVSSVVDGMKKCNCSLLAESGNMNFKIFANDPSAPGSYNTQDSFYYQGISSYNHNDNFCLATVLYQINFQFPGRPILQLEKLIPLGGTDLEAYNVLHDTLKLVVLFLDANDAFKRELITGNDGIFFNMWLKSFGGPLLDTDKQQQLLICILHILFKGTGDLFQEINSVCKFGGYSENYRSNNIISYSEANGLNSDSRGNTLRMFIANDQPSACRFAYLLLKGNPDYINNFAFGGYMGIGKEMVVSRIEQGAQMDTADNKTTNLRTQICSPLTQTGGKRMRITRRRKLNRITSIRKLNKVTRKYKRKLNRITRKK